ncbi:hypothetical protein GOEFS_006_00310 [Gordonia effusa NBRC 100432]|uniref:Branched-chain amino acid transporter n=1 Tax=Gordonia effusa NBRC 100432 TaxID=1077974 RepID=H0QUS7_9ACTN|nr:AzlD domain-containing protein [Gordonia effusa]GAB16578.1 hypothetical protein GOEFS_006_00310 [Gordonia effusa NBRC 100432]
MTGWEFAGAIALLAGGTYLIRVAGPQLRARLDVTPRVEAVLERATIVLLIAVALTSTLFIGSDVAGPARPIGVAVGILAAVLRAPLIVVIVAAAGTTAALRAAGMA